MNGMCLCTAALAASLFVPQQEKARPDSGPVTLVAGGFTFERPPGNGWRSVAVDAKQLPNGKAVLRNDVLHATASAEDTTISRPDDVQKKLRELSDSARAAFKKQGTVWMFSSHTETIGGTECVMTAAKLKTSGSASKAIGIHAAECLYGPGLERVAILRYTYDAPIDEDPQKEAAEKFLRSAGFTPTTTK